MILSEALCSHCQAAGLDLQSESQAVCRYCGTVNPVEGVICARCEFVNAAGAETCDACRQALWRRCPSCGSSNWMGAERCGQCDSVLDVIALAGERWRTNTADRLDAQQRNSAGLKAQEAADAQRRKAGFEAGEQRRQQRLHQAAGQREAQQRVWITVLVVAVVGFVVVVGAGLALAYFNH